MDNVVVFIIGFSVGYFICFWPGHKRLFDKAKKYEEATDSLGQTKHNDFSDYIKHIKDMDYHRDKQDMEQWEEIIRENKYRTQ